MTKLVFILICLNFVLSANDKDYLYELNNSAVMNLNDKNFNNQITFNRSKNIVSIVHYYKLNGIYKQ